MAALQSASGDGLVDGHDLGFQALPVPMALLDGDLVVCEANAALADLLQVPAASLTGEPLGHRLRSASTDAPGGDGIQTFQFQCPDGPRWMRLDLQEHGDGILAMLIDVTGERTVLERMKADYTARDRLMHAAEVGAWRYDPDTQVYHFPTELALGHAQIQEPVPLAVLQSIQHPDDASIDAAIRDRLTSEEGTAEALMRYKTGDGGWRHLRVLYRSGRKLKSGAYEMYGLSQNVTDLAMARDEANASAQRLKLALSAARAGVFGYDYAKSEYWMSPEFREMVGPAVLKIAAAAEDPRAIFHADDRGPLLTMGLESVSEGRAVVYEARILYPTGDRWMRIYWQSECNLAREPVRGVGLLLDIDEQKRQELALTEARTLAESATASKSSFLASVSHEIWPS
jgi:PAS domain-containing protein